MDAPGHGAGFKSDSYVPANRRVYDSPELFDTIMSYMSVKQVAVLLRLEKAAIERVMDHLGCRMVYSALELDEEAVIVRARVSIKTQEDRADDRPRPVKPEIWPSGISSRRVWTFPTRFELAVRNPTTIPTSHRFPRSRPFSHVAQSFAH